MRFRRTPNPEIQKRVYDALFARTYEAVHCYQMIDPGRGGNNRVLLVSKEFFNKVQHQIPRKSAASPLFDGMRIFVDPHLPTHRKIGSPHRQRWEAKLKARREAAERERQEREDRKFREVCDFMMRLTKPKPEPVYSNRPWHEPIP